jgi:tRNA pseudouridine55 synthase
MNGVIVIDKPRDWTSHDVVGKLRGILRQRRIGHGGTLDPMATGILPVFIGRATRAVSLCENADKEYIAGLRPGIVTDTQDITGKVLSMSETKVNSEELERAMARFRGEIEQIPPMYSAVKIGGKKLYDLARKGVEVEREPRRVTIKELELLEETETGFMLRVVCSKGTYIRTLCHDIGTELGCGGTLDYLRRTRAGGFTERDAVSLETVAKAAANGAVDSLIRPVDSLFSEYPQLSIDELCEKKCRCGADFAANGVMDGRYRVYSKSGEFLMLGEARQGTVKTIKSFFEVV